MQEFSSISVSTYDPDALVGQLNDKSSDGWSVIAIVPTGSTITAYLSREGTPGSATDAAAVIPEPAPEPAEPVAAEPTEPAAAEPAPQAAVTPSPFAPNQPDGPTEPAAEPAAQPAAEPAAQPAAEPAAQPAAEPAAQPATSAAPAGWYADPSGRFELRYWDGGTWTEHVSRAGQQYTDPPVA